MSEKLKVWHIPQVGSSPSFEYEVSNPVEAWMLLDALAKYDQFQLNNRIKPDYASCQGLSKWDEEEQEWVDYSVEDELGGYEEDITRLELDELKALLGAKQ